MFCPQCGAEYREGFTRCADCGVDLVPSPPEREGRQGRGSPFRPTAALTDPVCVYRSGHRGRLALAKSVLQSAGVPFVVLHEAFETVTGLASLAPVEILVSGGDADDARLLLEDLGRADTGPRRGGSDAGLCG